MSVVTGHTSSWSARESLRRRPVMPRDTVGFYIPGIFMLAIQRAKLGLPMALNILRIWA